MTTVGEEREFKDLTLARLPIKLKLKNEQSLKKQANKMWARELEIEVKNTGTKPIYYVVMNIILRDVLVLGHPYAFQVRYGRRELLHLNTTLQSDDVPLRPGETITLKISENQLDSYERFRDEEKRDDPKKVELNLQFINFGDGTGLVGSEGLPLPDPRQKHSQHPPDTRRATDTDASPPEGQTAEWRDGFIRAIYSTAPASFLRVIFFCLIVFPPQE